MLNAARQRERGEELCVLRQGHGRRGRRHRQHHDEGNAAGNEAVDLKRRPQRQIQRADAHRFERIRERLVAFAAKSLAPHYHRDSGEQADGDASGGADPVIVEGEFQKIRNTDQQRGDPDAVQPVRTDARFQVGIG